MKFISWYFERLAIGVLYFVSITSIFFAIFILCSVIFNFKPYVKIGSVTYGYANFKNGIPVSLKLNSNANFPDTTIHYWSKYKSGSISIYNGEKNLGSLNSVVRDEPFMADTILFKQHIFEWQSNNPAENSISSNAFTITDAIVYINVKNTFMKVMFILPQVLGMFFMGFCCWHFATLLQSISIEKSFSVDNFKRLNIIGFAFIIFPFISVAIYFAAIHFSAGISILNNNNNYTIYDFSGSPDYSFNFSYFFIGIAILIFGQAFKRGYQIQTEQELTV
jgi:hypothetical protein